MWFRKSNLVDLVATIVLPFTQTAICFRNVTMTFCIVLFIRSNFKLRYLSKLLKIIIKIIMRSLSRGIKGKKKTAGLVDIANFESSQALKVS